MNCPDCNSSNAYLGFMTIECVNPSCHHYSEKQKEQLAYAQQNLLEEINRAECNLDTRLELGNCGISLKKDLFQVLADVQPMPCPVFWDEAGTMCSVLYKNEIKYVYVDPYISTDVRSPEYTRLFCNNSYNNPPQNIDLSDEERISMCKNTSFLFKSFLKDKFVFDGNNEVSVSIGFRMDENGELKDLTIQKIY